MGSNTAAAYGWKRGEMFRIDPDKLIIIGRDTPDKSREDHPLWDERATRPINPNRVKMFLDPSIGYQQQSVISVCIDGADKDTKEPRVLVSEGRGRVMDLREANRIRRERGEEIFLIPAVYVKLGDATAQMIRMITGNTNRDDDEPLVKGKKAADLLALGHMTESQVATMFATSVSTLRLWMTLTDLHDDVKKAVHEKRLTVKAAADLGALPQAEQAKKLPELLDLSGERLAEAVEKTRDGRGRKRASAGKVRPRKQIEAFLAALPESETNVAKIARAVLRWTSGVSAGKAFPSEAWGEWLTELAIAAENPAKGKPGRKAKEAKAAE